MLAVEVGSGHGSNEKLTAVGVGSCIRHAEKPCAAVPVLEAFVGKLGAVDALTTGAIMVCEVSTLVQRIRMAAADYRHETVLAT